MLESKSVKRQARLPEASPADVTCDAPDPRERLVAEAWRLTDDRILDGETRPRQQADGHRAKIHRPAEFPLELRLQAPPVALHSDERGQEPAGQRDKRRPSDEPAGISAKGSSH